VLPGRVLILSRSKLKKLRLNPKRVDFVERVAGKKGGR